MITKSSRAWCVPVFTVFVPGGVAAVSYVSVYIYIYHVYLCMCMYISLWLTYSFILIMKLFKHTEKNEDYNKNPCTYNPGF